MKAETPIDRARAAEMARKIASNEAMLCPDPLQDRYDLARALIDFAKRAVAAEDESAALRAELKRYDDWASSMPDAGFNSASPRWDWWHRRPFESARAALAPSSEGEAGA